MEDIKSDSEPRIMQGVIDLSTELSMAQENTLSQFSSDQFIPSLVLCLQREAFPDIMRIYIYIYIFVVYATICLTHIMDILPNTCNKVVNEGGVKLLCEKMANFTYVDLAEAAIKALEKISHENPYSVLSSSGIPIMLNLLDFFEISVQVLNIYICIYIYIYNINIEDSVQNSGSKF